MNWSRLVAVKAIVGVSIFEAVQTRLASTVSSCVAGKGDSATVAPTSVMLVLSGKVQSLSHIAF